METVGGEDAGVYTYKTLQTQGNKHPNVAEQQALADKVVELIGQIQG